MTTMRDDAYYDTCPDCPHPFSEHWADGCEHTIESGRYACTCSMSKNDIKCLDSARVRLGH